MLQRRNTCSIGAVSLNVLRGQGFWCPGLSAAGGVRPGDMGHGTQGRGFCSQNSDLKREHDFNDLVLHLLIDTTYSECFVVLLCCTQLTCLLFSHCSESEILHHDKQYEPFYSSFVALSTHYITTVCGLSKCSPPLLLLLSCYGQDIVKMNYNCCPFGVCLKPLLNQILRQSVARFILPKCQCWWKGKPVNRGIWATKYWTALTFGCLFIGLTSYMENNFCLNI